MGGTLHISASGTVGADAVKPNICCSVGTPHIHVDAEVPICGCVFQKMQG